MFVIFQRILLPSRADAIIGDLLTWQEKIIVPPRYKKVRDFEEARAWVLLGNKVGYVDRSGAEVIQPIYDLTFRRSQEDFRQGKALVRSAGRMGYIDPQGHFIFPLEYDGMGPFSDGLAWARKGLVWNYIDPTGQISQLKI